MNDNKTKDTKKNELGSLTNKHAAATAKGTTSNCGSIEAKIVNIGQVTEKKKLEMINQIVKTTPSF